MATTVMAGRSEDAGDARLGEAEYAELVRRHRGELHAHCRRLLGSAHDAEDALQEALFRAWRARDQFQGRGSVRFWLYRIATNTALDTLRRRPRQVMPMEEEPPAAGLDTDPEGRYERREELERALLTADRILPGRQRSVLFLREALGFSAEETAQRLDMSVAAVNSALQRARATIASRADARADSRADAPAA